MSTGEIDTDRMVWARRELWLARARDHLHLFGPAVARDANNRPLEFSLLHLAWIAHANYCWNRTQHAGIFGLGGSAGFAVTLAAWLIGRDPTDRVKIVCANDAQAKLRSRAVRSILRSPAFAEIFPVAAEFSWNDHMAFTERLGHVVDPVFEARGVSAHPAGSGASVLIFDDVVDLENCSTYERRQEHKRLVDSLWMSRLDQGGRVLWIARPQNPDDTSQSMRTRADFCWLEQRIGANGIEQEVHGAGENYATEVRRDLTAMLDS